MLNKKINFSLLLALFTTFHFASISPASAAQVLDSNKTVATVGKEKITIGELQKYMDSRPAAFGGPKAEEAVARMLDEMVTAEILSQEALRLKMDRDPQVRRAIQQILSRELLSKKVEQPVMTRSISDEELKKYFNDHRREFTNPEEVRLADIFIAAGDARNDGERKEKRQLAEKVLAEARQAVGSRFGFSELVSKYSDQHPKYHIGDTGYFDRQGAPLGLDPALAKAAFSLEKNGALYDSVVETDAGFHVIMRVGYRTAVEKNYKDVAPQLEQRMRREELAQRRADYLQSLRRQAEVNVDEKTLHSFAGDRQDAKQARSSASRRVEPKSNDSMPPPFPGETR